MFPKSIILASFLGIALLAPQAAGQSNRPIDRDGDGRISRDEWPRNSRAFDRRDRDHNGYLTWDELPPAMRRQLSRSGQADRQRGLPQNAAAAVDRLDKNGSGVVEGYEWPYNRQIFHEIDRDRNSVLSRDELANISAATMIQLDRNNNQRIDPDEWPGGFAQFEDLDQNRDGVVSSDEYFSRGGEWQRRQRFRDWDKNRDEIISSTEWRSRPDLFHQLDRNGDGRLNWDEFMTSTERYDRPFGWDNRTRY